MNDGNERKDDERKGDDALSDAELDGIRGGAGTSGFLSSGHSLKVGDAGGRKVAGDGAGSRDGTPDTEVPSSWNLRENTK